jgi:hypothetical protein
VIDDGKILEQGSHDTLLLREDSLYRKLWTLQAGGFLTTDIDEEDNNTKEVELEEE